MKKSTAELAAVDRTTVTDLQQLPNVGPAVAADLRLLALTAPETCAGRDPYRMYDDLSRSPAPATTRACWTRSSPPSDSWVANPPSPGGSTRRNGSGRWRPEGMLDEN